MTSSSEVNEQSSATVTVSFFDENNLAVVPSSATYQINDLASGDQIVAETAIDGLDTSVDIEIPYAANSLVSDGADEIHVLTVKYQYGVGKRGTAHYKFHVKDLPFVTSA